MTAALIIVAGNISLAVLGLLGWTAKTLTDLRSDFRAHEAGCKVWREWHAKEHGAEET